MTPEQGVAPLTVRFDASETVIPGEEITGFEWLFGEEESAPQQRGALVEHTFELPGTFQVTLKAYTTSGKMYEGTKFIVVRAPVLDACAMPSRTSGKSPLGVSFNMACTTGNPTSILWDFGDGSIR
jgi:PKD repeat protein